jgi:hypothetical protein
MITPESTPTPAAADRKVIKDVSPAKPSSSLRGSFTKHAHIDFRTGMSGHRAALGSASHPHEVTHDGVKSMSNHAGAGSPVLKLKKTSRPRASIY